MAHYAFLDENNVVTDVIVGVDETELIDGLSPETYYGNLKGKTCKRTSYNAHLNGFRKNYAAIGGTYDSNFDAFIPLRPYPSWKLNYTTFQWEAPVPMPQVAETVRLIWSEVNQEWIEVTRLNN
jgi:hypothetical protein